VQVKVEDLKFHLPSLDIVATDLYGIEWRNGFPGKAGIALCPRHPDHNSSLRYDPKRDRIFCASQQCFTPKGVDALGLVQTMDRCDFARACERLANQYAPHLNNGGAHNGGASRRSRRLKNDRAKAQTAAVVRSTKERNGWLLEAEYDYGPGLRKVRFHHRSKIQEKKNRKPEKTFVWEHLAGAEWLSGKGELAHQVYLNRSARERDQLESVLMLESEQSADEVGKMGIAAGSMKEVTSENASQLAGMDIILWRDNDAAGRNVEQRTFNFLKPHVRSIRRIEPPSELSEGGDIIDAVHDLGFTAKEILGLIAGAKPVSRPGPIAIRSIPDVPSIRSYAGVEVVWIWEDVLAVGTVNTITGDAGSGKSTLISALCGAVSRGEPLV
jgi:hypothetical protein